jgi:hypothetical protein
VSSVGGYRQAEDLGGLQIDDQLEFGWKLYENVAGLCPIQNFVDEVRGAARPIFRI